MNPLLYILYKLKNEKTKLKNKPKLSTIAGKVHYELRIEKSRQEAIFKLEFSVVFLFIVLLIIVIESATHILQINNQILVTLGPSMALAAIIMIKQSFDEFDRIDKLERTVQTIINLEMS